MKTMSPLCAATIWLLSFAVPAHAATHTGATWHVSSPTIRTNGLGNTFVRLFKRVPGTDFAVQAQIRALGPGSMNLTATGFGVEVRTAPAGPDRAVEGGSFFSQYPEDNAPDILWNGVTAGGSAFTPKHTWHVYRLEVHGSVYSLSIDGRQMVTIDTGLTAVPVDAGIFSRFYRVEARDARVIALAAAHPAAPAVTGLIPLTLQTTDLPSTSFYDPVVRHFYTNAEVALDRHVTTQSIDATGRIVGYATEYYVPGEGIADLYTSVTRYATAGDAQAAVTRDLASFTAAYQSGQNFHTVAPEDIGDAGGGFTVEIPGPGYTAVGTALDFSRGPYTALVRLFGYTDGMSQDQSVAEAETLAKVVDARIQAGLASG